MHEVKEIETWILRLLSAPVPVPGKTRVEVSRVFKFIVAQHFKDFSLFLYYLVTDSIKPSFHDVSS